MLYPVQYCLVIRKVKNITKLGPSAMKTHVPVSAYLTVAKIKENEQTHNLRLRSVCVMLECCLITGYQKAEGC